MVFKKWWFWVLVVVALGVIGWIQGSIEENSISMPDPSYMDNDSLFSAQSNENKNIIDKNLVGIWINHKEGHLLEKLILNDDGTGFWDSEQITWYVEEQEQYDYDRIFFEGSYKSRDHEYIVESGMLRLTNGCKLVKVEGKGKTSISSLKNTRWVPDFVKYPNDFHVDNPVLELIYISDDKKR